MSSDMERLKRIQDYIKQTGITPSGCLYHTWRDAKNAKGQRAGAIRVLVPKSDGLARCEYICPECQHYGYVKQEWKRPFSVRCKKCGFKISVPRMRDEAKRELRKK